MPPTTSLAWLTWHLQWWLGDVLAEAEVAAAVERAEVAWPGSAEGVRSELRRLAGAWRSVLDSLTDDDLGKPTSARYPAVIGSWSRLVGWVNVELMKNAAEIGSVVLAFQAVTPAGATERERYADPARVEHLTGRSSTALS